MPHVVWWLYSNWVMAYKHVVHHLYYSTAIWPLQRTNCIVLVGHHLASAAYQLLHWNPEVAVDGILDALHAKRREFCAPDTTNLVPPLRHKAKPLAKC